MSEYPSIGINSLRNSKGQGRKPVFDARNETQTIQKVVEAERQKLVNAQAVLEKELNKSFSVKTLKNFLKTLAGATSE